MQPRVLLAVTLLALLVSARAEEIQESSLLGVMKDYMQQASKTANEMLTKVQESQVAENAREWMTESLDSMKGYWTSLIGRLSGFLDSTPSS
ncbi:apolipoprotein C-III precursor [Cavia porcellus]|uniref:Apolipoprotein C-III n=1 Tax=Cavia porcellus TaxID=10141 RepID=APOC3_CAVPO|nr:apolipoprotein C-III precursor [Cavia porcellus]XP_013010825.1 apolipoprotein C-III isoform X1 [Cavia porcellus]Q9Z2R5.1 RecName: Full=Apolipoprotein C-III; Short=Apo-CIII; Short=ApoC-III; AltName: Full=Apolipoprotein C3; Flags: Precursor [Cavia porcellus]AAD01908.1 apolipoprotein CIII [Cavia porcellus]